MGAVLTSRRMYADPPLTAGWVGICHPPRHLSLSEDLYENGFLARLLGGVLAGDATCPFVKVRVCLRQGTSS